MTYIRHDIDSLAPIGPLTEWLDAHVPDLGDGPLQASVLSGGQSNVVLTLDRGAAPMVLRRPPAVPPPGAERGVLRRTASQMLCCVRRRVGNRSALLRHGTRRWLGAKSAT
jgi:hypothetical protein